MRIRHLAIAELAIAMRLWEPELCIQKKLMHDVSLPWSLWLILSIYLLSCFRFFLFATKKQCFLLWQERVKSKRFYLSSLPYLSFKVLSPIIFPHPTFQYFVAAKFTCFYMYFFVFYGIYYDDIVYLFIEPRSSHDHQSLPDHIISFKMSLLVHYLPSVDLLFDCMFLNVELWKRIYESKASSLMSCVWNDPHTSKEMGDANEGQLWD